MNTDIEVNERAAESLLQCLWEWRPQVYDPVQQCSRRQTFFSFMYCQLAAIAGVPGALMQAHMALDAVAGDNFDYIEAQCGNDFEAVGKLVQQAAALLRAA